MTEIRHAGRAGALLIPIALIIAACSGATASGAPSTGPGSSTGTGGTSTAPSAAPAATAGRPSLALPSIGALPSFDITQLMGGLAKLDSYKAVISRGGVPQYTSVVVTKPVLSRDMTIPGDTRIVVIGDEAWIGKVGAPLASAPSAMVTGMLAGYDPTLMMAGFSGAGFSESAIDKGTEQKNGVSARHYRIDGSTLVAGFSGLPAGATIDTWVADEGYLVAVEAIGWPGGDLDMQVTNVNDPANKVERPS